MSADTISTLRKPDEQTAQKTLASGLFGRRLAPVHNTGILFERMSQRVDRAA